MILRGHDEDAVAVGEVMSIVTNKCVTTGMLTRRVV
jgi:hypothetical protein